MLGDVTVRHPPSWIRDVEEDVDRFPGADENGVLPDEVRLLDAVPCENEKSPCAVNVERVRHRMVGVHLVDEADLDLITDAEFPVDAGVFGSGVAIDELPTHVRGRGLPIHLDHVVFPLDSVRGVVRVGGLAVLMVVTAVVAVLVSGSMALSSRPLLVLARDGVVEPNLVWKDTVLVRTGEVVDIVLDVTNVGRWMAHCHIAEHHESGMMFSFDVTP